MGANPLQDLGHAGQAVWLDFVQRKMLDEHAEEANEAAKEALDQGAEAQEFRRTASRLREMRSEDYLDAWAARRRRSGRRHLGPCT